MSTEQSIEEPPKDLVRITGRKSAEDLKTLLNKDYAAYAQFIDSSALSFEELQEADRIVQIVLSKPVAFREYISDHLTVKPRNWAAGTYAPYFKRRYALEVKAIFDKMLKAMSEDKKADMMIPIESLNCSIKTAAQRVNQGALYLCELLDTPEKLYSKFRRRVRIKERTHGLLFEVKIDDHQVLTSGLTEITEDASEHQRMSPTTGVKKTHIRKDSAWRAELEEWIETGSGERRWTGLQLDNEEIKTLNSQLSAVPNLVFVVKNNLITVCRQ